MGATSAFDLPYPEGGDLVIEGDDAIQALAEAVEARMNPNMAYVTVDPAESALGISGATEVDFPGAADLVGFSGAGLVFTYAGGGSRYFIVSASVEVEVASAGSEFLSSTVEVHYDGAARSISHDQVAHTGATLASRKVTHNISVPIHIVDGHPVTVYAYASGGTGTLGVTSLRIYPIGPVTP